MNVVAEAVPYIILELVRLIVNAVGHETAQQLISDEYKRRANAAADAVAAARGLVG